MTKTPSPVPTPDDTTPTEDAASVEHGSTTLMSRREVLQTVGAAALVGPTLMEPEPAFAATETTPLRTIHITVNGTREHLSIDPRMSLLDMLRERLDLTGTKKGCNQGACGACTVLANGRRIVSCLTLAAMYDGLEIETIEGLAKDGELHSLQQAFIDHDGLQCGYCTPGQIMSGVACISEGHATSPEDIKFWMSGNICRCGAYPGIVAAIAEVAGSN